MRHLDLEMVLWGQCDSSFVCHEAGRSRWGGITPRMLTPPLTGGPAGESRAWVRAALPLQPR